MLMVGAPGRRLGQASIEEVGHQLLQGGVGGAGPDGDALLGEAIHGSLADAIGDDPGDVLFGQPTGKQAWLMRWGGDQFRSQAGPGLGIHFDECKLVAASEVSMETTVFDRDGDFHEGVV